jgi:hypothetical protein
MTSARVRATQADDLPHDFDVADDGYCKICGYDEDEDIHRIKALRQTADASKIKRVLGS